MEGEWSSYGGGKFNAGSGYVTEMVILMEVASCYRGGLEGGKMVYESGHFNRGRMVMLQRWPV